MLPNIEASLNDAFTLLDLDSADVASLIAEDVHGHTLPSEATDAWAPYESKMVSGSDYTS